ncbi:MAG: hypothetical protein IJ874_03310 [Ruminococcus sp.]|nr:hypothetical protein [Ruminococcus sp.]
MFSIILCLTFWGQFKKSWSDFLGDLPDNWEYIPESDNGDGRLLGGYFYYTRVLKKGEATPCLIEGIETDFGSGTNTDNITDFDMIVYSESVQTTETDESGKEYPDSEWRDAWKSFLEPAG